MHREVITCHHSPLTHSLTHSSHRIACNQSQLLASHHPLLMSDVENTVTHSLTHHSLSVDRASFDQQQRLLVQREQHDDREGSRRQTGENSVQLILRVHPVLGAREIWTDGGLECMCEWIK